MSGESLPTRSILSGKDSIGIDLGGTKIEGIALRGGSHVSAGPIRIATPRDSYQNTIAAIADLVQQLESQLSLETSAQASVGVGIPGSIAKTTGLVQNANSTWLNGKALQKDLFAKLERPVRLANDANCFALSEAFDGSGAGRRSILGVILGTGCGGGLVIDGKLIDGPLSIGGEWGHNSLPWPREDEHPGPVCWCGRHGCMEAWVSGPALEAQHRAASGQPISATAIATAAAAGDGVAKTTLARHTDRLARGLAHVMNVLDPEIVVLGGGLSKLEHLYRELPPLIAGYLFTDQPSVNIQPPRWGDASGTRGAARLWDAY